MANLAAYTILAAIVASGGIFLVRELRGSDAAEDASDRIAHGDIIRLPAALSPFHDEQS